MPDSVLGWPTRYSPIQSVGGRPPGAVQLTVSVSPEATVLGLAVRVKLAAPGLSAINCAARAPATDAVATRVPVSPAALRGSVAASNAIPSGFETEKSHLSVIPVSVGGVKVASSNKQKSPTSSVFSTVVVTEGATTEVEGDSLNWPL